jgi:hypothetical protein
MSKKKNPRGVSVSVELITPRIATALLEANVDNRKLRESRVAQYADMMKRGLWQLQSDAIAISETGKLLNGQHRLHALVSAGRELFFLVVRGVKDETFGTIDAGMTRTVNDLVARAGVVGASHITPVAKILIALDAGINIFNTEEMALITRHDIEEFTVKNLDELYWAVSQGRRADAAVDGIRTSWMTFAMLASKKYGHEVVEQFITSVIEGAGLKSGDPALALRNWLMRQRGSWPSGAARSNILTLVRTFNSWKAGQKIQMIRPWMRGTKEALPTIA